MNTISISGFKAYDLRGRIPAELNEDVAYRIGRAYAEFVKPRKVIVGRDIRLSSEELATALEQGREVGEVDRERRPVAGNVWVFPHVLLGRRNAFAEPFLPQLGVAELIAAGAEHACGERQPLPHVRGGGGVA
jgi:hypothetical protein